MSITDEQSKEVRVEPLLTPEGPLWMVKVPGESIHWATAKGSAAREVAERKGRELGVPVRLPVALR